MSAVDPPEAPREPEFSDPSLTGSLASAERAFGLVTSGPDPLALECTGLSPGVPCGVVSLAELRRVVTWAPFTVQRPVWSELVIAAQDGGPAWLVGVIGVALPALRRIASRVAAGRPAERDELDSEVLAGFCTALLAADGDDDRLPARLYWAAERAGRRWRHRDTVYATGVGEQPPAASAPAPPVNHPDLVLAAAVRDGVLSGLQAELIGRTRLERQHLRAVAQQFGLSLEQLRYQRRRGEQNLVAALTAGRIAENECRSGSHSALTSALQTGEGARGDGSGPAGRAGGMPGHPAPAERRADPAPRGRHRRRPPPQPARPVPNPGQTGDAS